MLSATTALAPPKTAFGHGRCPQQFASGLHDELSSAHRPRSRHQPTTLYCRHRCVGDTCCLLGRGRRRRSGPVGRRFHARPAVPEQRAGPRRDPHADHAVDRRCRIHPRRPGHTRRTSCRHRWQSDRRCVHRGQADRCASAVLRLSDHDRHSRRLCPRRRRRSRHRRIVPSPGARRGRCANARTVAPRLRHTNDRRRTGPRLSMHPVARTMPVPHRVLDRRTHHGKAGGVLRWHASVLLNRQLRTCARCTGCQQRTVR